MISVESMQNIDIFKYLWVVFTLFWFIVFGVSAALVYHWIRYTQIGTLGFRISQLIYMGGIIFLFFLSFFFFIKI